MSKLQEVFDRINESKKEQKELKKMYRDALSHSQEHQMILEEKNIMTFYLSLSINYLNIYHYNIQNY